MNVLLVARSDDLDMCCNALVPVEELAGVDLNAIDGRDANHGGTPDEVADAIVLLFKRLGFESDGETLDDLKKYRDPATPFTVDKVVAISWDV